MDFNAFVENIVKVLQEKMGEDYEIKVTKVMKNNDIRLTGVIMMRETDKVSPTIYLEEPYRQYREGTDLHEIADRIAALYEAQMKDIHLDMNFFGEFEYVKDRIFHKLINYSQNKNLLKDVPHLKWCDLAIVFYYSIEEEKLGRASILIHNNHLAMWNQTADTLYQTAQHNMRLGMPELLVPMQELINDMTGLKLEEKDVKMYVLTNKEKVYGASAMLYSDEISKLATRLDSDLLILPSSVHEVLLLPDERERKYEFYRQMVEEVNTTQVEPEEILSYNLYRYNRKKAEIEEIIV
ncbi:MAG: hypothetical protein K2J99_00320 [Lachnospiraceae bacterium]|nr:hypothetical protein [Lachnospiraceae bacterium]